MEIEIVGFPTENGDFPVRYVARLPEGNQLINTNQHYSRYQYINTKIISKIIYQH